MSRGLQTLLESAMPTLVLAVIVLVGGVGYGFYQAHQAAPEGQSAASAETVPAASN